jgi:hypothetical protein
VCTSAINDLSTIMNATRREFLQASAMASLASVAPAPTIALPARSSPQEDHHKLDAFELAGILW